MTCIRKRFTDAGGVLAKALLAVAVLSGLVFQSVWAQNGGVPQQLQVEGGRVEATDELHSKHAAFAAKLQAAVDRDEISQDEAAAKLATFRNELAGEERAKKDDPLTIAAEVIGMDTGVLWGNVKNGSSIADVARANGVDPQTVIDAYATAALSDIEDKVASGDVSAEEAAEWVAGLTERYTAFVDYTVEIMRDKKSASEEDCEEVGHKLRAAVANGEITEEEARQKSMELCGEAERADRGDGEGTEEQQPGAANAIANENDNIPTLFLPTLAR